MKFMNARAASRLAQGSDSDDTVIWIGDLSRESVRKAYIAMNKRRRSRAKAIRVKIDTGQPRDPEEIR